MPTIMVFEGCGCSSESIGELCVVCANIIRTRSLDFCEIELQQMQQFQYLLI